MEDMKLIALYQIKKKPTANSVLTGDVKKYDAAKGKIDVVYEGPDLADFKLGSSGGFTFPPHFTGPYSVEISGDEYPYSDYLQVSIDWKTPNQWRVGFGSKGSQAFLSRVQGKGIRDEFLKVVSNRPFTPRQPFDLSVEVKSSKVIAKANRKTLFNEKRKDAKFGVMTPFGLDGSSRKGLVVRIKGEIDPRWIDRKIADAAAIQMEDFADSYIDAEHLPEWLFEESENALSSSAITLGGPFRDYPGPEMSSDAASFFASFDCSEGSVVANLDEKFLQLEVAQKEKGISAPAADCLRMQLLQAHGRNEEAAEAGARMLAEAPDHYAWTMHYVQLQMKRGDHQQARTALKTARLQWPQSAEVFEASVVVEINSRLWAQAQSLMDGARLQRAFDSEEGMTLQVKLNKAIWGPSWSQPFSYESAHFLVKSQVSETRCEEIARLLESTYSVFEAPLRSLPKLGANKLRVFHFANEAKYRQYLSGGLELPAESYNGVYHRMLRQLIIWDGEQTEWANLTIVHEGFHQYLDFLADDVPLWFDEGMSLFLNAEGVEDGLFTTTAVRQDAIQRVLEEGIIPLTLFVSMPDSDFLNEATTNQYFQAWAFLQFLRDSGKQEQAIHDALVHGFISSASRQKVIADVFGFMDMEDLEKRFLKYLQAHR